MASTIFLRGTFRVARHICMSTEPSLLRPLNPLVSGPCKTPPLSLQTQSITNCCIGIQQHREAERKGILKTHPGFALMAPSASQHKQVGRREWQLTYNQLEGRLRSSSLTTIPPLE